jgi:hypothetical protein
VSWTIESRHLESPYCIPQEQFRQAEVISQQVGSRVSEKTSCATGERIAREDETKERDRLDCRHRSISLLRPIQKMIKQPPAVDYAAGSWVRWSDRLSFDYERRSSFSQIEALAFLMKARRRRRSLELPCPNLIR